MGRLCQRVCVAAALALAFSTAATAPAVAAPAATRLPAPVPAGTSLARRPGPVSIERQLARRPPATPGRRSPTTAPGGTWNWLNPRPDGNPLYSVSCPSATTCFAAGQDNTVLATANGGSTWSPLPVPDAPINGIACPITTECIAATDHGNVLVTTNGGASWTQHNLLAGQFLSAVYCSSTTACTVVGQAGSMLTTSDGGGTWTAQPHYTNLDLFGVSAYNWAVGNGVIVGPGEQGGAYNIGLVLFAISCGSSFSCVAVGANGVTAVTNGQTLAGNAVWNTNNSGANVDLDAISCPNQVNSCYATGTDGNVYIGTISSTPGGGNGGYQIQWGHASAGEPGALYGVSCSGSTCFAAGDYGVISSTTVAGSSWTPALSDPDTYQHNSVACQSTTSCVIVGQAGSIESSNANGGNWTLGGIVNGPTLTSVACPSSSLCVIVGSGGAVYTIPGAYNSPTAKTSNTTENLSSIACPSATACYAVGDQGLLDTSTDGATTWTTSSVEAGGVLTSISCPTVSTCYVTDQRSHVLVTSDGGAHWAVSWDVTTDPQAGQSGQFSAIACPSTTVCYAGGTAGLLATTLDGVHWRANTPPASTTYTSVLCSSVDSCFVSGADGTIINTSDDGASWTTQYGGPNAVGYSVSWNAMTCLPNAFCLVVGTNGGISRSTAPGAPAWTRSRPSTSVTDLRDVACADAMNCYATALDEIDPSAIAVTHDGGSTWTMHSLQHADTMVGISCPAANTCFGVGWPGAIYATTDGGSTWTYQNNPLSALDEVLVSVSCPSATTCYAVGTSGVGLVTTSSGASWQMLTPTMTQTLLSVSCAAVGTCVAVGDKGASETLNGTSWRANPTATTHVLVGVACPTASVCFAAGTAATLLVTNNAGASWTAESSGLPTTLNLLGIKCVNTNACVAAGGAGIVIATTDGKTWTGVDSAPTFYTLRQLSFTAPDTVLAVGAGGTVLANASFFTACLSASVSTNMSSPKSPGTIVNLTASSIGCAQPLYEFWVLAPGASLYTLAQSFGPNPTFAWDTSHLALGTYRINVWVRDANSPGVAGNSYGAWDTYNANTTFTLANGCTGVSESASPPSIAMSGMTVTVTASGSCVNPGPSYEFWVLAPGASLYTLAQAYSTTSTFSWNTTGLAAGSYRINVWVRDAYSSGAYSNASGSWDAYNASLSYTLARGCAAVGDSASPAGAAMVGKAVTVTAASGVCPNPQFEFWVLAPGASLYTLAQPYSSSATLNWNTAGLSTGVYRINVWVRDASSAGIYSNAYGGWDAYNASLTYTLTAGCPSVSDAASPAGSATVGTTVTVTASAPGCTGPQYEFWVLYPGASLYTLVQSYSASPTLAWNTVGLIKGTYRINVWVRDSTSRGVFGNAWGTWDAYDASQTYVLS